MHSTRTWDIFCKVIDNFGDIGVCWRLARNLALHQQQVRLWVDDASALAWMAPQPQAGVQVRAWDAQHPRLGTDTPYDVVIEAFGCEIDPAWLASRPAAHSVWINLEYLTAEPYAQRSHGLPSLVMHGPAAGRTKWFFYPGFTPGTGGLLREADIPLPPVNAPQPTAGQPTADQRISLFCYEPAALPQLLQQLGQQPVATQLLVTAGRASAAVQQVLAGQPAHQAPAVPKNAQNLNENTPEPKYLLLNQLQFSERLRFDFLAPMPQLDYDVLLRGCQLNFVRGEDSVVRALWAGQAFVWHIYPQADGAHAAKLDAFLDWLEAPADLRLFHHVWNGLCQQPLPAINAAAWQQTTLAARQRLLAQPSLVDQLLAFCQKLGT
jgi:uncharacterized repeat protein (TIGR03837 family)